MDLEDVGRSNKTPESHPVDSNANQSVKPTEILPEFIGKSGTSTFSVKPPKVPDKIGTSDVEFKTKKLRSTSSSSSSSEDLFQVDTARLSRSGSCTTSFSKPDEDTPGRFSAFQVSSKDANQSTLHGMLPTQSPSVQVMDRSGGYDPYRIPSSVFEPSKSPSPLEWSVASNDSLFSIHIGNNSFSRDYYKTEDFNKSGEFIMFNPPSPLPGWESHRKSFELEKIGAIEELDESSIKDETRSTSEDQGMEKTPTGSASRKTSSVSIHSNNSGISTRSFAFPIKKKKKKKCWGCIPFCCSRKKCKRKKCAWPSCYCSNCSCAFCYCKWPSCYFRWPSCYCSNCSWAFCYCWNCSPKRWCCHSSSILTDGERICSVKPEGDQQQQKPFAAEVPPTSRCCCSWFSCFSRPWCCSFRCFRCC